MSVKKNILIISWISFLLSSEFFIAKAMGPDPEPRGTGFIKHKPTGERSRLRLSASRTIAPLSQEEILKRDLKNAQTKVEIGKLTQAQKYADWKKDASPEKRTAYSEAKKELHQSRKRRNALKEELKKLKEDAPITAETKNSKKKNKTVKVHQTENTPNNKETREQQ
jgi:hypothetical protein